MDAWKTYTAIGFIVVILSVAVFVGTRPTVMRGHVIGAKLLETLQAYFETGAVATEAARRLHLSVRTITYRLAKVAELTGRDPTVPADRLTLEVAVLGARLLRWPAEPLPPTD